MELELTKKASKPGKRRLWIGGLVALAVAVLVAVSVWPGPREPEYQGKKLSEWVRYGGRGSFAFTISFEPPSSRLWVSGNRERDAAVRHLGTNVIPCFIRWAGHEEPRWKAQAAISYKRWPRILRNGSLQGWFEYSDKKRVADGVVAGFLALGRSRASAVPDLVQILRRTRSHDTIERVILCLATVGPEAAEAVPVLRECAERDNGRHRESARVALDAIGVSRITVEYF